MVTLHAFLALLAGFATTAVLAALLSALLDRVAPGWADGQGKLSSGYVFVSLCSAFLSAAAGGYVTAWTASANPLYHVLVLGIIVLVLAGLGALQARGKQPVWYQLALVVLAPAGVMAGGLARMRFLGIL